ncbi:hypothetical protein MHYP_G00079740 [Metynnis hypsauchen]
MLNKKGHFIRKNNQVVCMRKNCSECRQHISSTTTDCGRPRETVAEEKEIPSELTLTNSGCRSVEDAEKMERRQGSLLERQKWREMELAAGKEVLVEINRQKKIDEAKEERHKRLQHYYRNKHAKYEQSLKDLDDRTNSIRRIKKQIALYQSMMDGVIFKLAPVIPVGRNPLAQYPKSSSAPVTKTEKIHPCMWQKDSKLDSIAVQLLGLAFETDSEGTMAQTVKSNKEEMTSDMEAVTTDRGHWSRDQ